MINHPVINILWIILNLILLYITTYTLNVAKKKKKQNDLLRYSILSLITIIFSYNMILLFQNSATTIIIFIVFFNLYYLLKEYLSTKKNYLFITFLLLGIVSIYSFFTYTGAARLQIFLAGYPKEAYEIGLEELKYYEEKDNKKYNPIKDIELFEGQIGIIEVKNYLLIKIGKINKY